MSTEHDTSVGRRVEYFPAAGRAPFLAAVGVVLAAALTALAIFWDLTGNDPEPEQHLLGQFIVVLGVIIAVTALVHLLIVRTASHGNPGRRSLILGILGATSLAVFWAGLPIVLAAAATAAALIERDSRGRLGAMAKGGLGLAVLTTIGAICLAIAG